LKKTAIATSLIIGALLLSGCQETDSEISELSGETGTQERSTDTISMDYQEGDHGYFDINFTKASDESVSLVFEPVVGDTLTLIRATGGKGTYRLSCMPVAETQENSVKTVCDGIGPDLNGESENVSYTLYPEKHMVYLVHTRYTSDPINGVVAYEFTAEDDLQVTITKR